MSEEERKRVAKAQRETRPIAERIEEGTARHEPVSVCFMDGKERTVEVWALSSMQFRQATKKANMTLADLQEVGSKLQAYRKERESDPTIPIPKEMFGESWDFFQTLAAAAVKDPPDILEHILPNEEIKIATKTIELSQPPKT
jgi:hypothetical protein